MIAKILGYRIFGIISVGEIGMIGGIAYIVFEAGKMVMKLMKKKAV